MSFEWKEITLGSVCKFVQYGYTTKAKDTRNGIGFIRGTDISKNSVNWDTVPDCEVSPDNLEKYLVKNGDILITRMGTIGTTALVEKIARPSVFASYLIRHVVDSALAIPAYVGYVLKSEFFSRFISTHGGAGAVQPNINAKTLSEFTFPLPPLSHQRNIAEVLGAIDARITHLNETNATLEAIAQGLFKSWFVDFDPVRAKSEGKLPEGMDETTAALFPDAFEETELGLIPATWSISKIGLELKAILGGTPSRANKAYWLNGNMPWINSGKVNEFRITSPSELITEEALKKSATKLLPARTTVIAITGATLGQTSIAEIQVCANQSVIGLPPTDKFPTEYIYFWINTNIKKLIAAQTGGAQQHINKGNVEDLPILVPRAKVINCFKDQVEPLFLSIANNCFQISTLSNLRDTLLPRLISGQLRVADDKEEIEKVSA
jgi:type I restriction enzyme S subunit